MSCAPHPSTHHDEPVPSWRTSTVVTGPVGVERTGTSPDRPSPWAKVPTAGAVIPRYCVAKPVAAPSGVA